MSALRARCREAGCRHVWVVTELPMALDKVASLAKAARCPKCAADRPLVAA